MHKQRLGILIAAGVGILATFLPWANIPLVGSVYGTAGDGWITLVLFVITAVMTVLGDRKVVLGGPKFIIALLTSIVAGGIGIWKIVDFTSLKADIASDSFLGESFAAGVSIGIGIYLLVIAAIGVTVAGFVLKGKQPIKADENVPTTTPATTL